MVSTPPLAAAPAPEVTTNDKMTFPYYDITIGQKEDWANMLSGCGIFYEHQKPLFEEGSLVFGPETTDKKKLGKWKMLVGRFCQYYRSNDGTPNKVKGHSAYSWIFAQPFLTKKEQKGHGDGKDLYCAFDGLEIDEVFVYRVKKMETEEEWEEECMDLSAPEPITSLAICDVYAALLAEKETGICMEESFPMLQKYAPDL